MVRLLETATRLFGACILGVFAFVPCYISYHMLKTIFEEPSKFDLFFVVAFGISSSLAYFLGLLTFRAATGRGRKSDDGLLPPLAMSVFIILFGLVGVSVVAMGIWQTNLAAILGGIGYVAVVMSVWRVSGRNRRNET